ncbi:MAG TPA: cytochrome C oxidase subunit IV family protein [Caldimonas sp.]|nr:cytochrome C oxidase subunit IV family protein [Caldimonas sp.]
MRQTALRSHARILVIAWAALVALMLTSLGSAYLDLGIGNAVAGLAIAFVKSAIVLWLFMRLRTAPATVRIVGATALATLTILVALSGVDYATRTPEPAAFQSPRQAPALAGGKPATQPR